MIFDSIAPPFQTNTTARPQEKHTSMICRQCRLHLRRAVIIPLSEMISVEIEIVEGHCNSIIKDPAYFEPNKLHRSLFHKARWYNPVRLTIGPHLFEQAKERSRSCAVRPPIDLCIIRFQINNVNVARSTFSLHRWLANLGNWRNKEVWRAAKSACMMVNGC